MDKERNCGRDFIIEKLDYFNRNILRTKITTTKKLCRGHCRCVCGSVPWNGAIKKEFTPFDKPGSKTSNKTEFMLGQI